MQKLAQAVTDLGNEIKRLQTQCGEASEPVRAHRLICRDCRKAGPLCVHNVKLDTRCGECETHRWQRRSALERLDFLRFQQEYFYERDRSTIDDVSAGGKEICASAAADFNADCHLDDDCMLDVDEKLRELQLKNAGMSFNAECLAGAGVIVPASADGWNLGAAAVRKARIEKGQMIALTDEQRSGVDSPEQIAKNVRDGRAHFGTTVTDMLSALRTSSRATSVPDAPAVDTGGKTIADVSAKHTLNISQHTAFACGATALLDSLGMRLALPANELAKLSPFMGCLPLSEDGLDHQLVMCLTGAGGTGKSEVVKALREFAQRWGIADSLCVTATTGIAACVVHGMTWHKATGHFSFMNGGKAATIRDQWSSISVLVVDEISMMSARQLFQLNKWLQVLKGEPEKPFGGVHLIFSGDFFQLPPVRADTLYNDGSVVNGDSAMGRDLWLRTLNSAVILSENHRAKLDPAYAELLRVLREGTEDKATWATIIAALRSCMIGAHGGGVEAWVKLESAVNGPSQAPTSGGQAVPADTETVVITPENSDRIAINAAFSLKHIAAVNEALADDAGWRERGVLLIDAVFHRYKSHDRNPPRYDQRWQSTWRRITTEIDLGKKYAPVLTVIFGKRYMITQNINLPCGVANGMWAVVCDVQLRADVVPRWDAEVGAHRVDADQIECVVVRYPDNDWASLKLHTDLPEGHFVIVPDTPKTIASDCKIMTYNLGGNAKRFRITQLPLIQAHVISGHKSQGQTLLRIVIANIHRLNKQGELYCLLQRFMGWFYTAVSRTKTRAGLKLNIQQLPLEHMQKHRYDVLAEMARLQVLHEHTHTRMHGTAATGDADHIRLTAAQSALIDARRKFRRSKRGGRR